MKLKSEESINIPTIFNALFIIFILIIGYFLPASITNNFTRLNSYLAVFIFLLSFLSFNFIKKKELGGYLINYILIPISIFFFIIGFISIVNLLPKKTETFDFIFYSILIILLISIHLFRIYNKFQKSDNDDCDLINSEVVNFDNLISTLKENYFNIFLIIASCIFLYIDIKDFKNTSSLLENVYHILLYTLLIFSYRDFSVKKYLRINRESLYFSTVNETYKLKDIISIYIYNNCIELTMLNSDKINIFIDIISISKANEIMDYFKTYNLSKPDLKINHSF